MSIVPPAHSSRTGLRLRIAAQSPNSRPTRRIHGAWWPRTYDLTDELPKLLGELPHAWGQITSVTVNGTTWSTAPGRMLVANQVVRLHRTDAVQAPHTICLLAPGRGRWNLLVVAPDTTEPEAGHLMNGALRD